MKNKNTKHVGLIIKNRSLSLIEVETKNGFPTITNYSRILLEEGIVENDCIILNKEGFQEAVKKLFQEAVGGPVKTTELYISLPDEKAFSHEMTILKEKTDDVEFIKEVAADFIPIELSQAISDYKVIDEDAAAKTVTINFVVIQKAIVDPIIDALNELKLDVIKINVDLYCLIKSFNNNLNQSEGSFLLLNLEPARDLIAVVGANDRIFKMVSKGARKETMDRVKALLNISTDEEVRQLLIAEKRSSGLTDEQRSILKEGLKDYFDDLLSKVKQVMEAAQTEGANEIKRIYLTGTLAGLPEIESELKALQPEVPLKRSLQFLEVPLEIEGDALEGIGLCIDGFLPNNKNDFNLLPDQRKDEIFSAKIFPRIKVLAVILTFLISILTILSGLKAAGSYLNYRISSREIVILNEQTLNPYVTEMARQKQAQKQNADQILLLIKDSVPVSQIIKNLNDFNGDSLPLLGISYSDQSSGNEAELTIRAKAANREVTENFVSILEGNEAYGKIVSPLSNLVGKGERFINISLSVDKAKVTEAFQKAAQDATNKDNQK